MQQRNGIWYIRKRVPSDLVNVDKRGSVRISLDTAERKIAISRYALKLAEITAGFDRVRTEVRDAGNLSAALRLGRVEMLGRAEIEHLVKEWWARRLVVAEADRNYDDDQNDAGAEREELDLWVRRAKANGDDHFATVADHLLTEAGFAAKPHRVAKGPNNKIGNKSWAVKKPVIANSAYEMNKKIGVESDWTKAEIDKRQSELATLALIIWPV